MASGERAGRADGRTLTVTLPLPDRRLCGNGAAGRVQRSRLVRDHRAVARWAAYRALVARGWTQSVFRHGPRGPYFPAGVTVRIAVTVRREPGWAARRLDAQNLIHGLKAYVDGLQDGDLPVLADDRYVQWGDVTWETALPWRGEVILTLTAVLSGAPGEG